MRPATRCFAGDPPRGEAFGGTRHRYSPRGRASHTNGLQRVLAMLPLLFVGGPPRGEAFGGTRHRYSPRGRASHRYGAAARDADGPAAFRRRPAPGRSFWRHAQRHSPRGAPPTDTARTAGWRCNRCFCRRPAPGRSFWRHATPLFAAGARLPQIRRAPQVGGAPVAFRRKRPNQRGTRNVRFHSPRLRSPRAGGVLP